MRRAVLLAFLAMVLSACSEPLEFADWTIPVPDGTRIVEYAAVPIEERTERIEIIEELVLGNRDDDPDYMFYTPQEVDADADGNVYVLDAGELHIKVFDAEGEYVRTISREGQGPGELARPTGMVVLDNRLVIHDTANARFTHWSLDGSFIDDFRVGTPMTISTWPSPTGLIVALHTERMGDYISPKTALLLSPEGELLHEYASAPHTEIERANQLGKSLLGTVARASTAVGSHAEVYFADGEEYQIHRFDPEGPHDWALRVAWQRTPTPIADLERRIERIRERRPDALLAEYHSPDTLPALGGIATDGHGHLWVFPYVPPQSGDEPLRERPVDVYSADGELLFAGIIELPTLWVRARGDHVYRIDSEGGETTIHRLRLVEPF